MTVAVKAKKNKRRKVLGGGITPTMLIFGPYMPDKAMFRMPKKHVGHMRKVSGA